MPYLRIFVLGCLAFVFVGAEFCVKESDRGEITTRCLFSPWCDVLKNATLIKPLLNEELRRFTGGSQNNRMFQILPELVRCRSTLSYGDYTGCDPNREEENGCEKACGWLKAIVDGVEPWKIWGKIGM